MVPYGGAGTALQAETGSASSTVHDSANKLPPVAGAAENRRIANRDRMRSRIATEREAIH